MNNPRHSRRSSDDQSELTEDNIVQRTRTLSPSASSLQASLNVEEQQRQVEALAQQTAATQHLTYEQLWKFQEQQ